MLFGMIKHILARFIFGFFSFIVFYIIIHQHHQLSAYKNKTIKKNYTIKHIISNGLTSIYIMT